MELAVVHGAGIADGSRGRGEDRSGHVDRISLLRAPCENALTNVSARVRTRLAAAQAATSQQLGGAPPAGAATMRRRGGAGTPQVRGGGEGFKRIAVKSNDRRGPAGGRPDGASGFAVRSSKSRSAVFSSGAREGVDLLEDRLLVLFACRADSDATLRHWPRRPWLAGERRLAGGYAVAWVFSSLRDPEKSPGIPRHLCQAKAMIPSGRFEPRCLYRYEDVIRANRAVPQQCL